MPTGLVAGLASLLGDIGIPAGVASVAAPALLGAGGGALISGITGGNPLTGALTGGALGGVGSALSGALSGAGAEAAATGASTTGGTAAVAPVAGTGAPLSQFTTPATSILSSSSPDTLTAALNTAAVPAATAAGTTAPSLLTAGGQNILNTGAANFAEEAGITGAVTGAAPAAASSTGILGTLGNAFSSISDWTSAHPLLTLGGGLLASQLLAQPLASLTGANTLTSQEQNLLNTVQPEIAAANALVGDLASGQLPPGGAQAVQQSLASDIAQIQARYAALGMSGSSAEAQDIANAQNQSAALTFQLAQQATTTGLSAAQIGESVYTTLVQDQLNKQQQLQNALTEFMSAVGGATALGTALNPATT